MVLWLFGFLDKLYCDKLYCAYDVKEGKLYLNQLLKKYLSDQRPPKTTSSYLYIALLTGLQPFDGK